LLGTATIRDVDTFRTETFALHGNIDGGHAATDDNDISSNRQCAFVIGLPQVGDVVDRVLEIGLGLEYALGVEQVTQQRVRRLAVGLLVAVACSGSVRAPRHLLLISVDTLRADHLGLYGYPRPTSPVIDELGRHGVVFENAIVQWPVTTPSMVSMFSGTYPHENGIVIIAQSQRVSDELEMFPEVLQARGFRTAAVISNGALGRESNFGQGFDVYRELWIVRGGETWAVWVGMHTPRGDWH